MYLIAKRLVAIALGLLTAPILIIAGFGILVGTHTFYCPWQHWIHDLAVCVVLDKDHERILIQHANLDTNEYYLEIVSSGKSEKYQFPSALVEQVGPGHYSAKLVPDRNDYILVNEEIFPLVRRSSYDTQPTGGT